MGKLIKRRYAIQVDSYNTAGPLIRISKKVFDECLKNYQDTYDRLGPQTDDWNDSSEYHIAIIESTIEQDTYKMHTYRVDDGATTIYLYEFICKDGYHFTK